MPPARPVNPLRQNRREISAPTNLNRKPAPVPRAKRACPNKLCSTPDVVDGVCHSCGAVVDDSNIVAEVQFAENSSGAAVVQGSYVGADQGGVRTMGPGLRRMGGDEGREGTVRLGRQRIQGFANQIRNISENVIQQGVQIFKIAAMNNFIQGRRLDMVAAVCLYSACRKEQPCTVMLIDFADICQVNVFKLGKTFKDLHSTITISKDGIRPILPEDLVYRFAAKLEFGSLLDKVADDACRLVKRMSFDWMVMGRRPSGVCGACLVLAARMNNFRRTITEVVYVVKVTTHTIKKRLDEFSRTSTSHLTIEEFLNEEWSRSDAHDPPSFYEKTEEFQKTKKQRKKRKKYNPDAEPEDDQLDGSLNKRQRTDSSKGLSDADTPAASVIPKDGLSTNAEVRRDAEGFVIPPRPPQFDDIPIDPELLESGTSRNAQEMEVDKLTLARVGDLIGAFGDEVDRNGSGEDDEIDDIDDDAEDDSIEKLIDAGNQISHRAISDPLQPRKGKKGPDNRDIHVSEDWERDERDLAEEIMEMITDPAMNRAASEVAQKPTAPYISDASERTEWGSDDESERPNAKATSKRSATTPSSTVLTPNDGVGISESAFDPHSAEYAVSFEDASVLAANHVRAALQQRPQIQVSMDEEIGEDEFADDPEVMNCVLSAEASAAKEKIWVNENRNWLRKQQLREYQRQMAANGPPKATRNRKKKPRIGEGASAASSPAEAAVDLMKQRSFSKKINYDAISAMFDQSPGSRLGSAATSRVTSRAGSAFDSRASSVALSDAGSDVTSRTSSILTPEKSKLPRKRAHSKNAPATPSAKPMEVDSEPDSDDDDYVNPKATLAPGASTSESAEKGGTDWRAGFDKEAAEDADEDAADEDGDDTYGYENGDLDDENPFDTASVGGMSNNDFDDDGY